MSLHVVATPIGPLSDLSQRGLEVLQQADLVIGEERKQTLKRLKQWDLLPKPIELLNEHSTTEDIRHLSDMCKKQEVALISDCGTPGFCDPGAALVEICQKRSIAVKSVPGPSSLMAFLSICGEPLSSFFFRGFLPAKRETRDKEWFKLTKRNEPIVVMDTPYRLTRTLQEVAHHLPQANCILGTQLSQQQEAISKGKAKDLLAKYKDKKLEFVLLIAKPSR